MKVIVTWIVAILAVLIVLLLALCFFAQPSGTCENCSAQPQPSYWWWTIPHTTNQYEPEHPTLPGEEEPHESVPIEPHFAEP